MEELDLKELLYFFMKKIWYIIIVGIIGAVAGFVYTKYFVKPMYSSYTTVVLSKISTAYEIKTDEDGITKSDMSLNSDLVDTYSEILKSRAVAQLVKNELNLDVSEGSLMSNTSVTRVKDTELLKINVSNANPQVAADIANVLASVFQDKVKEIYGIENVTVIDTAIPNNTPKNVSLVKNVGMFSIAGCVAVCGVLFVIFYFDTRIKSKSEVEELLGLEVIGVIPDID